MDDAPRPASQGKAAGKPRHSAISYAVRLLSKREYSAADLQKKLLARGYDAEETSASLRFVQEHNYQFDARYAGTKARSAARRAGDWKIARQLAQKIWRYLGYRGFSGKAIKHAVNCLKHEQAQR